MNDFAVILDTDIGSDIDDAVALAYLLKQPRCEVVGITTVSGEPEKRAALASAILNTVGRNDIPIHVGIEDPLLGKQRQPHAPQAEALTDEWPHRTYDKRCTAIEFLRDTIHSRPGEIVLCAIGPLTNIAILFAIDPEIPALLKGITLMGGRFYEPSQHAEWNILCDPHAAQRVFQTPIPSLTAIGLDVTLKCTLEADECRRKFTDAGGPLAPVAAMAEVWFRQRNHITFHDPLAVATLFEPDLCTYESADISVDMNSGATTPNFESHDHSHRIAKTVDPDRFVEHYFGVVS